MKLKLFREQKMCILAIKFIPIFLCMLSNCFIRSIEYWKLKVQENVGYAKILVNLTLKILFSYKVAEVSIVKWIRYTCFYGVRIGPFAKA